MFTVYVLHSQKYDKIYIGYTSDLESRIESHNKLSKKGWTRKFRPWRLIHTEEFDMKEQAMKRERQLKSYQGRLWIRKKIAMINPIG
ncbi:MAG: GIY-YIG nuclease family protein [Bacteroidetes bacterium]|nr:GIY-YIG nuclease family protein [Bacteroidota bacterium]